MKYINQKAVKDACHDVNKQATKEFIYSLDCLIDHVVKAACTQFNGSSKRVSSSLIPSKFKVK